MKPEVMYEGIGQLDEFTPPEILAAVQEAGDKAFAESAKHPVNAAGEPYVWVGAGKKPRSDKGTKRPKPQPAPEPEQKAGGLQAAQVEELNRLIRAEFTTRDAFIEAEDRMHAASDARIAFIDSLAK